MKLRNLYTLFLQFAKYNHQGQNKIDSLQTFAVLSSMDDLLAENLGKTINDRQKEFFFSKKHDALGKNPSKVEFEYPAMFVLENDFTRENPFKQKRTDCFNMQLAFLYPYLETCQDNFLKRTCQNLTIQEIEIKMQELSATFFDYLCNVVCVTEKDKRYWINEEVLKLLKSESNNYRKTPFPTIDIGATKGFQQMLDKRNTTMSGRYVDCIGKDNLYGMLYNFTFCTTDCEKGLFKPVKGCCSGTVAEVACC